MKNKDNEEALNEYLDLMKDMCPELIDLIYPIFKIANTYSNEIEDYLQLDPNKFEYEEMNMFGNLKLVKEFIEKIDKENVEVFNKAITDGVFDIFYIDEFDNSCYLLDKPDEPICIEDDIVPLINIPLNGNIQDGAIIVHEFYHSTNSDKSDSSNREILTELISIYMELRYLQFLEDKGYSILNKGIYDRVYSTFAAAINTFFSGSVLDIYNSTSDISTRTLKFIENYKEEYKAKENKELILDFSKDNELGDSIFDFHYDAGYLLGGIISIVLINNPEINDIKIKYINNNLDKISLKEVFKILEFDIDNYMPWIDDILSKLEGVVNEKSNSYSRANRSR